jgi:protein-S-isoprenylcysteine O-methyltransferase Ste14
MIRGEKHIFYSKSSNFNQNKNLWIWFPLMMAVAHTGVFDYLFLKPYIPHLWIFECTGLLMIICGITLRIIAISTLRQNFSYLVGIREEHELITSGIYTKIRHPSYTGGILINIGIQVCLFSLIGILITIASLVIYYGPRIRFEEDVLRSEFPEHYEAYKKSSWRLILYIY